MREVIKHIYIALKGCFSDCFARNIGSLLQVKRQLARKCVWHLRHMPQFHAPEESDVAPLVG